mmetsp:Transcript_529/g.1355  ORF Transcript_529/g.1355 Transcript_529/m.1355 type:complete len:231 (+) Transcript_529:149-841(+)
MKITELCLCAGPRAAGSRPRADGARRTATGRGGQSHGHDQNSRLAELREDANPLVEPLLQILSHRVALHALQPRKLRLGHVCTPLRLHLRDEARLLLCAVLCVRDQAFRGKVLDDKLTQRIDAASTVIILAGFAGGAREVLHCRESLHPKLLAEVLAIILGAVHVRDKQALAAVILIGELVPRGLHSLAMATPGREELHKGILARLDHFRLEVVAGEERCRAAHQGGVCE